MLNWIWNKIKQTAEYTWYEIKSWSGWETAGSIFIARMTAIGGFFSAVLAGMDWSFILNLDFTNGLNEAVLIPSFLVFMHGLVSEITRRTGANDL